ncbi:hypothetical protein [Hyunsoonleella pacifica]|uniref:Uncharacterized protein n=1 Tax=Hyunsoonleella pacifica TaxID=1080224 RepID=A0A4Q9FPP8_9FLAO|nr:hypothetical protein [Hyunsoonleella pacifica]TBN14629.1 hypothetical protein EYD46_13750 [Hyunsoonleella pacifica]GGD15390.1 hypothetical protein GCM10011368_16660 [Hyunsoonleella pacifica]
MKKKLESELISVAHRILKLKGKEDVLKMHEEARILYEKLSVLKFAHENFEDDIPTIGNNSSFFNMLDTAFNNKISDNIEVEDKIYINLDDVVDDDISEPVMNKIKDMVEFMPEELPQKEVDEFVASVVPKKEHHKSELEDLTADFKDLPVFEPISKVQKTNGHKKVSLNDRVKSGGLNIGLNDKIAFIKHLFDGNTTDYDRVISQLNTTQSLEDANRFIETIIKPDYNNWLGKEEFEERFKEIIEAKFN